LTQHVWNKPVISIFKERNVTPEVEPFVVVKARKLVVNQTENSMPQTLRFLFAYLNL
jgi:hypothetical protein